MTWQVYWTWWGLAIQSRRAWGLASAEKRDVIHFSSLRLDWVNLPQKLPRPAHHSRQENPEPGPAGVLVISPLCAWESRGMLVRPCAQERRARRFLPQFLNSHDLIRSSW